MEENIVKNINSGGRKCRNNKKVRNKKKYTYLHNLTASSPNKYEDVDPLGIQIQKSCMHKSEKSKFRCNSLNIDVVLKNRRMFYANKTKVTQDFFLSRLLSTYEPVRRNKIPPKNLKKRQVSCTYNIFSRRNKAVPVCKKFFMSVFSVNEKRLRNLNMTLVQGNLPKENRGGDHRSHKSVEKKEKLREFLNNLPAQESHYNRTKSKRVYLSSELYPKKLMKIYNDSVADHLKMKANMFYKIFHGEFNIGFNKPSSDACNTCTLLSNQIKTETDSRKKTEFMIQKRIHKLRSNAFYEIMKQESPDSMKLCFDLQQVLPLPKTPIQDCFYSRQISLYNFCIYNLDAKEANLFIWDETEASRGATEIGSALYSYLSKLRIPENIKVLRLFCDGCGGQNKNCFIIHTLIQWLYAKSPNNLSEIQLHYPVRGHSFLPADRVFGRIEKDLRRYAVLTKKEEYVEIISQHGVVHKIGSDWHLKDVKGLSQNLKKMDGIQKLKRIYIQKQVNRKTGKVLNCKVLGHEHFKFDCGNPAISLLKQGKRIPLNIPTMDRTSIPLTAAKKKDVNNLLVKQFGEEWKSLPDLIWFKTIIDNINANGQSHEHDADCECNEPEDLSCLRI